MQWPFDAFNSLVCMGISFQVIYPYFTAQQYNYVNALERKHVITLCQSNPVDVTLGKCDGTGGNLNLPFIASAIP